MDCETTYHGEHGRVDANGNEKDYGSPLLKLIYLSFSIFAFIAVLGLRSLYSTGDKAVSYCHGHGWGETSFRGNLVKIKERSEIVYFCLAV